MAAWMTYHMADSSPEVEETVFPLPAFIKAWTSDDGNVVFDYWRPNCPDNYETGAVYYRDAVSVAIHCGSPNLLVQVVGSMRRVGIGALEVGFLEALAAQAVAGRAPDAIPQGILEQAEKLTDPGFPDRDELQSGINLAHIFLEMARHDKSPLLVQRVLVDAACEKFGYGAVGLMWAICRAAYAGKHN